MPAHRRIPDPADVELRRGKVVLNATGDQARAIAAAIAARTVAPAESDLDGWLDELVHSLGVASGHLDGSYVSRGDFLRGGWTPSSPTPAMASGATVTPVDRDSAARDARVVAQTLTTNALEGIAAAAQLKADVLAAQIVCASRFVAPTVTAAPSGGDVAVAPAAYRHQAADTPAAVAAAEKTAVATAAVAVAVAAAAAEAARTASAAAIAFETEVAKAAEPVVGPTTIRSRQESAPVVVQAEPRVTADA